MLKRLVLAVLLGGLLTGVVGCSSKPNPYFGKQRISAAPPRDSGISRGE